jgi:prepilin-type N-terminal cleavage/methylation domain-containing protein
MTTTTVHSTKQPKGRQSAFTLTELLIVMTLSVLLSGVVFASFGFVLRSGVALANYSDMTSEGRRGLEVFARDVRTAQDITQFDQNSMTLQVPQPGGGIDLINYRFNEEERRFERVIDGEVQVLMNDVRQFFFRRFNVLQQPANNNLETKQIQLELSMVKEVIGRDTSERVVSARYIMRNKQVTQ